MAPSSAEQPRGAGPVVAPEQEVEEERQAAQARQREQVRHRQDARRRLRSCFSWERGVRHGAQRRRPRSIVPEMTTIFSRIISGEMPGTFVWRDDEVRRVHVDQSDGPWARAGRPRGARSTTGSTPSRRSRRGCSRSRGAIGVAQERAFACERVGVVIAGYEVPHTHVHVIPTNTMRRALVRQRRHDLRAGGPRSGRRGDPRRAARRRLLERELSQAPRVRRSPRGRSARSAPRPCCGRCSRRC